MMRILNRIAVVACVAAAGALGTPAVRAQTTPPAPQEKQPVVTVEAKDADVRDVLTKLFKDADVKNFAIGNDVAGYITITLKNQPLEAALNLIARTASPRLTWSKTDGVYEVKRRAVRASGSDATVVLSEPQSAAESSGERRVDVIHLMYADARDIVAVLTGVRPEGMTGAFAYLPLNSVLTRYGRTSPAGGNNFASGTFGYGGIYGNSGGGTNPNGGQQP